MQKRTLGMILLAATVQLMAGSVLAAEAWICSVAAAVSVDEDGTVGPPELGERERRRFSASTPPRRHSRCSRRPRVAAR